jgi:hypothetical protein
MRWAERFLPARGRMRSAVTSVSSQFAPPDRERPVALCNRALDESCTPGLTETPVKGKRVLCEPALHPAHRSDLRRAGDPMTVFFEGSSAAPVSNVSRDRDFPGPTDIP